MSRFGWLPALAACLGTLLAGVPAPVGAPVGARVTVAAPVALEAGSVDLRARPNDWGARLPLAANKAPLAKEGAAPVAETSPLTIPLVQGYDSFGLNIPDLDEAGRLRSIFVIGAVSRVDDRSVEIRDSFLETYKDDGSQDFSIDLKKATLDRFTRVLVAKVPVTIRRQEFEVRGETMEFNTTTREGGLGGPIKMIIYNGLGGESASGAAPAPAASSSISVGSNPAVTLPDKAAKSPSK